MKKLDLKAYRVSEMSEKEILQTTGGSIIGEFLIGVAISILKDIVCNPSEHAAAFVSGMRFAQEQLR